MARILICRPIALLLCSFASLTALAQEPAAPSPTVARLRAIERRMERLSASTTENIPSLVAVEEWLESKEDIPTVAARTLRTLGHLFGRTLRIRRDIEALIQENKASPLVDEHTGQILDLDAKALDDFMLSQFRLVDAAEMSFRALVDDTSSVATFDQRLERERVRNTLRARLSAAVGASAFSGAMSLVALFSAINLQSSAVTAGSPVLNLLGMLNYALGGVFAGTAIRRGMVAFRPVPTNPRLQEMRDFLASEFSLEPFWVALGEALQGPMPEDETGRMAVLSEALYIPDHCRAILVGEKQAALQSILDYINKK